MSRKLLLAALIALLVASPALSQELREAPPVGKMQRFKSFCKAFPTNHPKIYTTGKWINWTVNKVAPYAIPLLVAVKKT